MEVISMGIARRRLMKDPGRSNDGLRRAFMARCIAQEPRLELVRAEEPFHACALVHDERSNEVPIARLVEAKDPSVERREAKSVELKPAVAWCRDSTGVLGKE